MSNPDGVLEAIDACLNDSLSPDAMRWSPDEPDPTPEAGLCPYCFHELPRHPQDRDGSFVCSRSLFDPPSCSECRERQEMVTRPVVEQLERCLRELYAAAPSPWQRAYLNGLTQATPAHDDIVRITMPDGRASIQLVAGVVPGEPFGGFTLTMEPIVDEMMRAFGDIQDAGQRALEGFGKAFTPMYDAVQSSLHKSAYKGVRGHKRRCSTCNPDGFPKPLPIDGHEYNRRRRRRSRR